MDIKKTPYFLSYEKLEGLIQQLAARYRLIGPVVQQQQLRYAEIQSAAELPWGYVDEQEPGHYHLNYSMTGKKVFAWVNSAFGIKPFLFKSSELMWKVKRNAAGVLEFLPEQPKIEPTAFFAIRPCDLRALLIQDKVFLEGQKQDVHYAAHRSNNFIVVANCTRSSNNCFCVAMEGYPRAEKHFDIALTEINNGFLFEIGNKHALLYRDLLELPVATREQIQIASESVDEAARQQKKSIDAKRDPKRLFQRLEHPHWETVANQCLSCGNCTQVCPTCFCHDELDVPSLQGDNSEHYREWGSCFNQKHSYIHGKTIRPNIKTRYRQWLTHKFSTWHDQFGSSGCVGCGRCITWCPTGIDVTTVINTICEDADDTTR